MSERILIIDDEEHIRRMMRLTLESAGYEVGEAAAGPEGIRLYGKGNWSAVVLDQRMPGMDGLETLRRIKQSDPQARVVMATAYGSIELAVNAMKLGASDFVRKPMTPEGLRNALSAAIRKSVTIGEKRSKTAADEQPREPSIGTITMNGFTILDPDEGEWQLPQQRRFTVLNPTGSKHDVVVQIDEEVLDYVERMTRKRLSPESSFWTAEARRFLSDFLWTKSEVPPMKVLILKEIDRDALVVAERWQEG